MEKWAVFDFSVFITTYNCTYEQLEKTLRSVIKQKDITFEIIIADDGSSITFWDELDIFFTNNNFKNYVYVKNKNNAGLVSNIYSALKIAQGRYVKSIGQGDMLYDNYVLKDMYNFMIYNGSKIAFGKLVSFSVIDCEPVIHKKYMPQDVVPYLTRNNRKQLEEGLFYLNIPSGACLFYETQSFLKYIGLFNGNIRMCEDNVAVFYLMDGCTIDFNNRYTLWYEFGNGISTAEEPSRVVISDIIKSFELFNRLYKSPKTYRAYKRFYSFIYKNRWLRNMHRLMYNPGMIFHHIVYLFHRKTTQKVMLGDSVNLDILKNLCGLNKELEVENYDNAK